MTDAPVQTERAYPGKESTPETAEETLRGIAERNAGTDLGVLVNLMLAGVTGDDVQADDAIPAAPIPVGTRQTDAQGQEYEYREDGWHRVTVETAVQDTVATTGPVTRGQSVAPEPTAADHEAAARFGGSASEPGTDESPTPPWSGTPSAPNTTVDGGSTEGPET